MTGATQASQKWVGECSSVRDLADLKSSCEPQNRPGKADDCSQKGIWNMAPRAHFFLSFSAQGARWVSICLHLVCHLGSAPVWTINGWACSPWDQGLSSCPAFSGRTSPGTVCPGKQWVDNFLTPNNSDSSFILKRFVIVSSWPGHPLQSSLGKSLHRSRSSVDWSL